MNVLVTGGAGFIGSNLVEALVREKHHVKVVDNFSTGSRKNLSTVVEKIELVEGDLAHFPVAETACDGVEVVFHLAATPTVATSIADPQKTQRNGEVATLNLLQAAKDRMVRRFVLASSCSIYGNPQASLVSEETPAHPLTPYAASKVACEAYCRAFANLHKIDTVALRYFNVYGPNQDPESPYSGVISILTNRLLSGQTLDVFGDGKQTRDFVFVGDIVNANLLAMQRGTNLNGGAYNIGTGRATTILDLIDVLQRCLQRSSKIKYLPERKGEIRHSQGDVRLAEKDLGYTPRPTLEEGLRLFAESIRNQHAVA